MRRQHRRTPGKYGVPIKSGLPWPQTVRYVARLCPQNQKLCSCSGTNGQPGKIRRRQDSRKTFARPADRERDFSLHSGDPVGAVALPSSISTYLYFSPPPFAGHDPADLFEKLQLAHENALVFQGAGNRWNIQIDTRLRSDPLTCDLLWDPR